MSKPIQTAGLTSLQQLILNEPNQRFILWIIANDDKAFSSYFLIELGKQQQLLQPNAAPNLAKAMVIYQNLLKKGMVDASNPLKTKITWRGQFYRLYTHKSLQFWGTVVGVIGVLASFGIIKFGCTNGKNDQVSTQSEQTKQQIVQPVSDHDSSVPQTPYVTKDSVSLHRMNQNDTATMTKYDSTYHK